MSTKGRIKFSVSGSHYLLNLVRDHFIRSGYALVSWDEKADFCLIGAALGNQTHPPVAQLELQKMQIGDMPVLLLSSSTVYSGDPLSVTRKESFVCLDSRFHPLEVRSEAIYALAAEHLFGLGECLVIRPFNVYGPDIHHDLVQNTILASKRKDSMLFTPTNLPYFCTSFLYQDDFLRVVDKLLAKRARGVFNVGSPERSSYIHLVRNIWNFVNDPIPVPPLVCSNTYCDGYPSTLKLEHELDWLPKTTLRSGVFKML